MMELKEGGPRQQATQPAPGIHPLVGGRTKKCGWM